MDIESKVFFYAEAIQLGKISDQHPVERIGCSRFLRDVLPVIERRPDLTATAHCFIDGTTIAEVNGYARRSLIVAISAVPGRKEEPR
jgi:hypothetical protein